MHAVTMNSKKNRSPCPVGPFVRITRARAKSLCLPPLYPVSKPDEKVLRTENAKKAASGSTACPEKRAVLKDVTNVRRHNAGKDQHSRQDKEEGSSKKKGKVGPSCIAKISPLPGNNRENKMNEMNKVNLREVQEIGTAKNFTISMNESFKDEMLCKKEENMDDVIDVDSKHDDPLMCSLYAPDIYYNLYTTQLARRPLVDYIENVQRDITQDMRAILIDWLVEVSDEYRMVPDSLYLTVNLIDRFLSHNYIEKQKLQLLGVTCMLIASKYEEICAPRVEEFCFITDNTYTKEEVVQMERRVLNFVGFHLSVPTTKKFLRRFIQASQVSYEAPSAELQFLANYLAELTLIEYSFLKFLPSLIAASAVFLARWTLDQSQHPWNPTLEHYTRHKSSELKMAVFELQELQLNTRGCVQNVIREKYKQSKFKCVSMLGSSKPVQSLF